MAASGAQRPLVEYLDALAVALAARISSAALFERFDMLLCPATAALAAAREEATIPYEELRIELDSRVALHITVTERVA